MARYGNSTTIAFDVEEASTAKLILLGIAEKVASRLREHEVIATVIAVEIVDYEFKRVSHQTTLYTGSNTTNEIYEVACKLFDDLWDGTPIRHIGIHSSKVKEDSGIRQLTLFEMDRYEKLSKVDAAVDKIRERFGDDSIMRASFVKSDIYHMTGGISPEKRKVDYKDVKGRSEERRVGKEC